jgi:AsmA protein
MSSALPRILSRLLKITGITIGGLLLLLFLLPYLFPGFVSDKIRQWASHSIKSELHFSTARLSFFRHFPALTLTLHDVKLNGSAPFEKETLIEADEIALGVDLRSIFSEVDIDKIFLTNANINIQVDTAGHANYNIYAAAQNNRPETAADSNGASLKIQKIIIERSKLTYNDASIPILVNAQGLDYEGNGDLTKAVFDLHTHMKIESLDFYYDRQPYFINKKVNADLITKINTGSLALIFERNELLINQLPVTFTGQFSFMKNGYDMDFQLKAADSSLHNVITALPPDITNWLAKTDVRGSGDIEATLKGKYIAATNTMPDLLFDLKIRNGYIANEQAPVPVSNLYLDLHSRLPGLNPDSLDLTIDSAYFNLDKDYFSAILRVRGMKAPWINANIRSGMDLEKWDRAFGFAPADLKGRLSLQLQAEGQYATRIERHTNLRKTRIDTVIASIPHFSLSSTLRNGYFKFASRPEAINDIAFDLDAFCPDNDYRHLRLKIDNLNARVLTSYIRGFFHLEDPANRSIDAGLETVFHLADLKKAYPSDSVDLAGDLSVHLKTKGNYLPARHQFPVTEANLQLTNGSIQTKYYPHPLEKIQIGARVVSRSGSTKDLDITLTPMSFLFEGQPFMVKADLRDFTDLDYNITSQGTLDLGRILQVFALKDYTVTGLVETRLSLRGRQSDATKGHYDRLFNEGSLKVKDLQVRAELFPLPFHIYTGDFGFQQDKMNFSRFDAGYGKSRFALDGWLTDVIGYMTGKGGALHGSFELKSDHVVLDELMAFHTVPGPTATSSTQSPAGQTGVIIVPADLAVAFHADIKQVDYNGLRIDSFSGGVSIDSGAVHLDTTTFTLAGAPVEMNATYKSLSPQNAQFDYHIRAKDFDVQRAYREVKLFRDLATSASKAQGIISLDYKLAGRLDGNMHPVYPSLKGGGVVAISKVKVKGLKLFGEVSKETNKDVNDPDLSKVELKTTIASNLITIERTRMKISAFKLRIEGQASFDGRLNLHCRVGLPPFGVIGIPVSVTGTQENPKVKARRGSKSDQLEETEDKEEEGKENE